MDLDFVAQDEIDASLQIVPVSSPSFIQARSPGAYVHARNRTQASSNEAIYEKMQRRTLMPVTIKQINDGWQTRNHSSFLINNSIVSSIKVIGQVFDKKTDEYKGIFKFLYCSGSIKASIWFTVGRSEIDCIPVGAYASIVGSVNMEGTTPEIQCYACKPITNFNDITHHHLSVIATHIDLVFKPKDMSRSSKESHSMAKQVSTKPNKATLCAKIEPASQHSVSRDQQLKIGQTNLSPDPSRHPSAEEIMSFIHFEKNNFGPEGLHIGHISDGLMVEKEKMREILDTLVTDGEVYTTIDADHFAPS